MGVIVQTLFLFLASSSAYASHPFSLLHFDSSLSGKLTYERGTKREEILLVGKGRFVGFGLKISDKSIPQIVAYKGREIVHFIFTRGSKIFSTLTLLSVTPQNQTSRKTVYMLTLDSKTMTSKKEYAHLFFTWPPLDIAGSVAGTDEQRLSNAFFANSGRVFMERTAAPTEIAKNLNSEKLVFLSSPVRLELDASLTSPFMTDKGTLRGKLETTLYAAKGKNAEQWLTENISKMMQPLEKIK